MKETTMTTHRSPHAVTRRATLAALAGGGLGMALHAAPGMAAAQGDAADYSDHPMTGTWLAMANPPLPESPQVAAPSYFGADGFVLLVFPVSQAGPNGVQFNSAYAGVWEPHDEQTCHFTATQMISDAEGTYLGTVTVDGFPHVNDDGRTFIDDGSLVTVTIRDPSGAVVDSFPGGGGRAVTGVKLAGGESGFPNAATPEATPEG
jgi:hypothetical protein